MNTSSTAQGGGGSFKNRKPIGAVGCCESRMAERSHGWTERYYLPTYLPIYLCIYLSLSLSFSFISLPIYLSICLSIHLSIYLSLSVCLCVCLSICKLENAAIQRDFLNFCTWQHLKRSNSARLPHFFSWQHQKRSNSARYPSKIESWVQSWWPRTNAFCDFSSPSV